VKEEYDLSGSKPDHEAPHRRVLVVDDNKDSAETLAVLLRMWEHQVQTAADGPGALAAAKTFQPELVFLDIGLPGMSGYEVAKQFRDHAELRHAVLVAMTGYGQDDARHQAQQAGFDHYLVKPVAPEILEEFLFPRPGLPASDSLTAWD
jgi:CheY-like chemotaxis protein